MQKIKRAKNSRGDCLLALYVCESRFKKTNLNYKMADALILNISVFTMRKLNLLKGNKLKFSGK